MLLAPPEAGLRDLRAQLALLPAEVECHLTLRLVEDGRVREKTERVEMLERVFLQARQASFPFRVTVSEAINPRGASDVGLRDAALQKDLDGLGLRARAAALMLREDRRRAREMVEELGAVTPPAMTCADGHGYSLRRYWETLAAVVERGYTEEERRDGRPVELMETRLRMVGSAFDVEPAMRVLRMLAVTPGERARLAEALAESVARLRVDARSLQASFDERWVEAAAELGRVLPAAERAGLARALREYVAKNAAGLLCRESLAVKYEGQGSTFNEVAARFNEAVTPMGGAEMAALAMTALPPERDTRLTGEAGRVLGYWDREESTFLLRELQRLRQGGRERQSAEWQARADEYLQKMQRWRESTDEAPAMVLNQMCVLFTGLLDTLPAGPAREALTLRYARFLESEVAPVVTGPEWLHHVEDFVARGVSGGQKRESLLEVLERQGGRGAAWVRSPASQ